MNAEGVREFHPGVVATPGPRTDEDPVTLKVLASYEQIIRERLRRFTVNETLIPGVATTQAGIRKRLRRYPWGSQKVRPS